MKGAATPTRTPSSISRRVGDQVLAAGREVGVTANDDGGGATVVRAMHRPQGMVPVHVWAVHRPYIRQDASHSTLSRGTGSCAYRLINPRERGLKTPGEAGEKPEARTMVPETRLPDAATVVGAMHRLNIRRWQWPCGRCIAPTLGGMPATPTFRVVRCTSRLALTHPRKGITLSSRIPTSRWHFATADRPGPARESPPATGRAASGIRAGRHARPRLQVQPRARP